MRLEFEPQALEDLQYWVEQDRRKAARALRLVEECLRSPFAGSGKPEPLKHALAGCWSRRIDHEHRLVYRVDGNSLIVLACRFHY
jgi:toxin YoeB